MTNIKRMIRQGEVLGHEHGHDRVTRNVRSESAPYTLSLNFYPFPLYPFILFPYFLLMIIGVTMPSDGGHGLLTPKSLLFISSLMGVMIYLLATRQMNISQANTLVFLGVFSSFLFVWLIINLLYGITPPESGVDQFKLFWLTLTVVGLSVYYYEEGILSFSALLKTIVYANCLYSCAKILLVLLHVLGMANMLTIMHKLGVRYMTMAILGNIQRIQTSVDIVTPFLLFFFLHAKKLGIEWRWWFKPFYIITALGAIFLSFSRFLMAVALLGIVLDSFTGRLSAAIRTVTICILLCGVGVWVVGYESAYKIVERRLFSNDNYQSDRTRDDQVKVLLEEHEQFALFGKGLGGYSRELIRDPVIMHSYEVQWVAFLMQFGLFGLTILLIPAALIAVAILNLPITRQKCAVFVMFLWWLSSGLTNPFLISLASGIMYSLFLLIGREIKKLETQNYEQ